jgi:hypothetical protein
MNILLGQNMNEVYSHNQVYGMINLFQRVLRLIQIVIKRGDTNEIGFAKSELFLIIESASMWKETIETHKSLKPLVVQLTHEIETTVNDLSTDEFDVTIRNEFALLKQTLA